MHTIHITAAYAFFPIEASTLPALREELMEFGKVREMRGLVLIAAEGINGTVSGSAEAIAQWKERLRAMCPTIECKDSSAEWQVFSRWSVKVKREIVALKKTDIVPNGKHRHISSEEWNRMIQEEDPIIIDTRNDYEYAIGRFKNAINPEIDEFHEFPQYLEQSGIPKDKKVMVYCTGGIRCEKALIAMEQAGYEHVYQLDGGILAYLEKHPEEYFEGECFVFDHRVAVDQHLQPSKTYKICPFHGDPAQHLITCQHCHQPATICHLCVPEESHQFCSKRCRGAALQKRSLVR